jgi:antitoxin component HigA of HigAB toxin-antitoxin module
MSRYLSSVMKVLPAVQAQQIVKLLDDLRAKGEVRDAEEYESALRNLATLINADTPKPSFSQVRALAMYLCSSDAHNVMMQSAKNDIEALFLQVDDMGAKLNDHHQLVLKSMVADLEQAIGEQEDTIRRLQILASSDNEFSNILVNSFKQTSLKSIQRSMPGSENLFIENRTGKPVSEDEVPTAYVSEHGRKIVLSSIDEPRVVPVSATLLSDSESYGTELNSSISNTLASVIDGTQGTFWVRTVYLSSPVDRVSTVLEFDIGEGRDVNYCIIEGASKEPFYISEMWGIAPDGRNINLMLRRANLSIDSSSSVDVAEPLEDQIEINGWERIDFEQVFVKKIKIKFLSSSYENGDFYYTSREKSHSVIDSEYKEDLTTEDIAPATRDILISEELAKICRVPKETTEHINKYAYVLALDNVWFGNGLYNDSSIFVSEPVLIDNPGVISVKAIERNVGIVRSGTDEDFINSNYDVVDNAGSVEYEIIRHRLTGEGKTLIDHFPVPMLNQVRVIRERLVLFKSSEVSNIYNSIGFLRFCPNITATSNIEVYRNNKLMSLHTSSQNSYQVAYSLDSNKELLWTASPTGSWETFSNWDTPGSKLWIKINNPSSTDIYTVNYNIRTSKPSETVYMDGERTVFMGDGGRLQFNKTAISEKVKNSEVYLQATLRRNSSYRGLSPEVHEYALLIAPYI